MFQVLRRAYKLTRVGIKVRALQRQGERVLHIQQSKVVTWREATYSRLQVQGWN